MLIDLKKVEPIDKVVIRINYGDRLKTIQCSPNKLADLLRLPI